MCGISGYLVGPDDRPDVDQDGAMAKAIRYRGLDNEGAWRDESIALFHSRLSIVALADGNQPMSDVSGRYQIVFNGEIYNYLELKAALAEVGVRFRTASDTEVILECFKKYGENCVRRFNGMFAIAIWDTVERQLFLARDRLGKKPLYWAKVGKAFRFASTLDALRGTPGWREEISQSSLALYSIMSGFPEDCTIWRHAKSLPPGCWMRVKAGCAPQSPTAYWAASYARKSVDAEGELLENYGSILEDAIRIRLRAEVPLALTFSGGVDSGTIAAICAKKLHVSPKCYTLDYDTPDEPSPELAQARFVAHHLDLDLRHIQYDYRQSLLADLRESHANFDQPCQQLALVYALKLYQSIKPTATVVLSGNAADELFMGYNGDEAARRLDLSRERRQRAGLLERLMLRVAGIHDSGEGVVVGYRKALRQGIIALDLPPDARDEAFAAIDSTVERFAAQGVATLLDLRMAVGLHCGASDSNYRIPDIAGLTAQVEVRSPFLDYRMVEFAAALPPHLKIGDPSSPVSNKFLMRRFYERYVPKSVAWAPKMGMGYNLKWHLSIATDPKFRDAFAAAYRRVEMAGHSAEDYRSAWRNYIQQIESGNEYPATANTMMNGFMFGTWLDRSSHE